MKKAPAKMKKSPAKMGHKSPAKMGHKSPVKKESAKQERKNLLNKKIIHFFVEKYVIDNKFYTSLPENVNCNIFSYIVSISHFSYLSFFVFLNHNSVLSFLSLVYHFYLNIYTRISQRFLERTRDRF